MVTFVHTILTWYSSHQRDLPWRKISDPYRIWVSEIILQQTRVNQGYEYYLRFIEAFPTVDALAAAEEDEVLRLWQGLGYYSRARNMHAAAQEIVNLGEFPKTYEAVRKLKGVGDYTAAAICSFAYQLPCAVLDGNVYRVLSRYFGITTPIDTGKGKKEFAQLASELLPEEDSADYNQAMMDFGALQCIPKSPQCASCPLNESCVAYNEHMTGDLPVKSHRIKVTERYFVYLQIVTPEGIWLRRRPAGDIWQGLYEFPLLEFERKPSWKDVMEHPFMKTIPHDFVLSVLKENIKHVLTHRIIWSDAYKLKFEHAVAVPQGFISVKPEDLDTYGMSKLQLMIMQ